MFKEKIIRAWKDPDFRAELSEEERAEMPENPAGAIELTDDELDMVAGGSYSHGHSYTGPHRHPHSNSNSNSNSYSNSNSSRRSHRRSHRRPHRRPYGRRYRHH